MRALGLTDTSISALGAGDPGSIPGCVEGEDKQSSPKAQ